LYKFIVNVVHTHAHRLIQTYTSHTRSESEFVYISVLNKTEKLKTQASQTFPAFSEPAVGDLSFSFGNCGVCVGGGGGEKREAG
jgi:hypothetical protein